MTGVKTLPRKLTNPISRYTKDHLWVRLSQHKDAKGLYDRDFPIHYDIGITRHWIKRHKTVKLGKRCPLVNAHGATVFHDPNDSMADTHIFELDSTTLGSRMANIYFPLGEFGTIQSHFLSTDETQFFFEWYLHGRTDPEWQKDIKEWGNPFLFSLISGTLSSWERSTNLALFNRLLSSREYQLYYQIEQRLRSDPSIVTTPTLRYTQDFLWVKLTRSPKGDFYFDFGLTPEWLKRHLKVELISPPLSLPSINHIKSPFALDHYVYQRKNFFLTPDDPDPLYHLERTSKDSLNHLPCDISSWTSDEWISARRVSSLLSPHIFSPVSGTVLRLPFLDGDSARSFFQSLAPNTTTEWGDPCTITLATIRQDPLNISLVEWLQLMDAPTYEYYCITKGLKPSVKPLDTFFQVTTKDKQATF